MIVRDLNVHCAAGLPPETKTPLIVDADTVLPFPVTMELLQSVARWHPQIIKRFRGIDKQQCAQREALNRERKPLHGLPVASPLRPLVAKRLDHVCR